MSRGHFKGQFDGRGGSLALRLNQEPQRTFITTRLIWGRSYDAHEPNFFPLRNPWGRMWAKQMVIVAPFCQVHTAPGKSSLFHVTELREVDRWFSGHSAMTKLLYSRGGRNTLRTSETPRPPAPHAFPCAAFQVYAFWEIGNFFILCRQAIILY